MSDPELGFVEGNRSPGDSNIDRPVLNTKQAFTHVVEDGSTQVARGGIECALDGGTVQIGMYDVTDAVVGAPRVFKRTVTLPERPLSTGDGYEVDSHTFSLDPVELDDYVGRELAVAVGHDRARLRGRNWPGDHPDEYGWGISSGDRKQSLPETWGHELQDRGSPISAGLFVEPVDVPAGKARTVVGSETFGTRSQTVFGAFPGITPESGMVVQYDERTAAGARVAVLPNGVVEIGAGSSATDTVAVSVRDSDGTWHGPETITLTER